VLKILLKLKQVLDLKQTAAIQNDSKREPTVGENDFWPLQNLGGISDKYLNYFFQTQLRIQALI